MHAHSHTLPPFLPPSLPPFLPPSSTGHLLKEASLELSSLSTEATAFFFHLCLYVVEERMQVGREEGGREGGREGGKKDQAPPMVGTGLETDSW